MGRRSYLLPLRATAGVLMSGVAVVACAGLLDIPEGRHVADTTDSMVTSIEGGAPKCTGTIVIKGLADYSGPTKSFIAGAYGELDLVREINANGGIFGCPIDFEVKDFGYVSVKATALYDAWKASPEWPNIVAFFGWGMPDGVALGPKLKEDKRPLITASNAGLFAAPDKVGWTVNIPVVNDNFEENVTTAVVGSAGFPYTYFAATDYSTSARIAMVHAKLLGAKRIGFVRCSDQFCRETALAAQEYAKRQGLSLGRELVRELSPLSSTGQPVPTGTQQSYEDGVYEYFQKEKAHVVSEQNAGRTYQPVDFLFSGNLMTHTIWLANGLKRVKDDPNLGYDVQLIANKQGFDEHVLGCANCVGRVHGILAVPAYGDLSAPEMGRIMALHDKWRKIDRDAALADGGDPDAATESYTNGRYVQGYVHILLFKIAAERVIRAGKPVTGENLKEALDAFSAIDTGGITINLRFTPTDHRPQSSERFYKVSDGQFMLEAERSVVLEDGWLGW